MAGDFRRRWPTPVPERDWHRRAVGKSHWKRPLVAVVVQPLWGQGGAGGAGWLYHVVPMIAMFHESI